MAATGGAEQGDSAAGGHSLTALLEALEAALPARLYLGSLIRLLQTAEDAGLRRRALRLFAARVAAGSAADEDDEAADGAGCA